MDQRRTKRKADCAASKAQAERCCRAILLQGAGKTCLLQQAFVKDGDMTVEQYMNSAAKTLGGTVKFLDAVRFEKGEGIEKKQENFAEEIAKLAK